MAEYAGLSQGVRDLLKRQEETRASLIRPPLPYTQGFRTPISYIWSGKSQSPAMGGTTTTPRGASTATSGMDDRGKSLRAVMEGDRGSAAADAGLPDFLAQSAAALQGVDYSGVASQFQDNAAVARARVASLYKALQRERGDAEAIYQGYRDTAEESIGASADQASADIAAGYESALQNQADEMAALGLADTLAQSATANMAEDQGYNMGTSARMGNAYRNANTLGGAADLAYNQGMIGSAGFASAEGQAQIDQQLSNLLANLSMREQEANAQLPMQQLQYAQGLQSMYQANQPGTASFSELLEAQQYASSLKEDERQTFLDIFKGYQANNDPEAFAKAAADMEQLKTIGLFG